MANALPAQSWSKPESVNLPSELRISKFAEARVNEINALSDFIGKFHINRQSPIFFIVH